MPNRAILWAESKVSSLLYFVWICVVLFLCIVITIALLLMHLLWFHLFQIFPLYKVINMCHKWMSKWSYVWICDYFDIFAQCHTFWYGQYQKVWHYAKISKKSQIKRYDHFDNHLWHMFMSSDLIEGCHQQWLRACAVNKRSVKKRSVIRESV